MVRSPRVEFYQGTNRLGSDLTSPYSLTISGVPANNYSGIAAFTAKAYDNSGAVTTSSPVAVTVTSGSTVNSTPPTVTLTAPANGTIYNDPATIIMTAIASDADGSIARVEFYQGKNKLGERYASPFTWTIYNAPAYNYSGAAALTARAVDNRGAVTISNAVAVTVY